MNKLWTWSVLLMLTAGINIFLFGYSNADQGELVVHSSQVKAIEDTGNTTTSTILEVQKGEGPTELMFTGDVMLGRTVMSKSKELNDYTYPFKQTAGLLSSADLTIINLENPIIERCPIHKEGFRFCSEPESVSALNLAGVDIANLANNHSYNWGVDGFKQTISTLAKDGILSVGDSNIVYKKVKETKFAFMGFDFVTNPYILTDNQIQLVQDAANNSDVLIISVHWGNEYKSVANEYQRNMAAQLLDLGVDVIVGHHPHWIQDVDCFEKSSEEWIVAKNVSAAEFLNGIGCDPGTKPVYYSLGNFVFDQMWSEETKKGAAVKLIFEEGRYLDQEVYPTYMSNWAQPEWLE